MSAQPPDPKLLRRRRIRRVALATGIAIPVIVLAVGLIEQYGPLEITPPPAGAEPGRWVHIEGVANTRDIGGYPAADGQQVKRRTLYRSGKLNRLSSNGAQAFRDLQLETVIDFCNRLTPLPLFGGDAFTVHANASVRGSRPRLTYRLGNSRSISSPPP